MKHVLRGVLLVTVFFLAFAEARAQDGEESVAKETAILSKKVSELERYVEVMKNELNEKLSRIIENQKQIMEELKIIKVRATLK